ncbi:MAG: hypothetical protein RL334_571 [Chloroflexota bacterium]
MKNRNWSLMALGALATGALVLGACQPQVVEKEVVVTQIVEKTVEKEVEKIVVATAVPVEKAKVLRVNLGTYPDLIDPQKSSFVNEIAHLNKFYEGLTRLDAKLVTVPAAAESWAYNADATELTFSLRAGLMYSDGSVLNAKRFE